MFKKLIDVITSATEIVIALKSFFVEIKNILQTLILIYFILYFLLGKSNVYLLYLLIQQLKGMSFIKKFHK